MLQPGLTYCSTLNAPNQAPQLLDEWHCYLMLPRQRLFSVTDCMMHSGILFDIQTHSGWWPEVCVWSQKCHPYTPRLLWVHRRSVTSECKSFFFFKHLSLGKSFLCHPSVLHVLCGTVLELFCSLSLRNKSQLGLVKNQERQQRCDNPRVKGVNTRREFHAWEVCRMAPVFSLFTHANEQYADEQTWAQPRLHAAQTIRKRFVWLRYLLVDPPLVCCLMGF